MQAAALERELRLQSGAWAPWLVYADWLSERGDVRGRLIALEHHRANARLRPDEVRSISAEIDELVAAHQDAWLVSDIPETFELEWRYGFIVGASFPLAAEHFAEHFAELRALLEHPQARLLSSLCLREADRDEPVEFVEEMLEGGYRPPPIAEELLTPLFQMDLSQIVSLAIEYSPLAGGSAQQLAACPTLTGLRALDLRYAYLDDEALALLLRAPTFDQLRSLKLQRNRMGEAGARELASSPALTNLTTLDLRENPLGKAGAEALADSPNLARLESLYLYFDDVGREGARALSTSPYLRPDIRRHWAGLWSARDVRASAS
jgi:uncharacterized protein (TIGR02996 family)